MKTITLVACAAQKLDCCARARDLYQSDLFKKSRALAQREGDWMILSAEHGLVDPATVLAPYNTTLTTATRNERVDWARRVVAQLDLLNPQADRCVVLAGRAYREFLMHELERRFEIVEVPLEGLGIGQQKQRLNHLIAA